MTNLGPQPSNAPLDEDALVEAVLDALGIGTSRRNYDEVLTEENLGGSTSWSDAPTPGPAVTLDVPVGGGALLLVEAEGKQSSGNTVYFGIYEATDRAISGTTAAHDRLFSVSESAYRRDYGIALVPCPAGGSRTYTVKYAESSATGTGTVKNRKLLGIALGWT